MPEMLNAHVNPFDMLKIDCTGERIVLEGLHIYVQFVKRCTNREVTLVKDSSGGRTRDIQHRIEGYENKRWLRARKHRLLTSPDSV
jgi:hypothetical protein